MSVLWWALIVAGVLGVWVTGVLVRILWWEPRSKPKPELSPYADLVAAGAERRRAERAEWADLAAAAITDVAGLGTQERIDLMGRLKVSPSHSREARRAWDIWHQTLRAVEHARRENALRAEAEAHPDRFEWIEDQALCSVPTLIRGRRVTNFSPGEAYIPVPSSKSRP